jgi:hypothetical protein
LDVIIPSTSPRQEKKKKREMTNSIALLEMSTRTVSMVLNPSGFVTRQQYTQTKLPYALISKKKVPKAT